MNAAAPPPLSLGQARLAMLASAALWGSATVLTKGLLERIPAFTLLALQLAASLLALCLVLRLQGRRLRLDRSTRRAGRTGLLEPGLAYAVGIPGVALTTAGAAALIAASEPALVCLLAWWVLGQRPSLRVALSILLAMSGVLLVSLSGETATATVPTGRWSAVLLGDALVLIGTAFAALYVVLSSRDVQRLPALELSIAQQSTGLALVSVVLVAALLSGLQPWDLPGAGDLLLALLSGVLQYALPFWLYLRAVQVIPVARAAVYLSLTPVFGVLGGVWFLDEALHAVQALGAVLIVLAVRAVNHAPKD